MIDNKYGLKKRLLIWLHEISPAFQVTKRFSLAFKKRGLLRRLKDAQAQADSGLAPLFQNIEIETINRCNGGCRFCPVNRVDNPRPLMKMPTELFNKIISDLKAIDYQGKVCLYSNNEPFLDDRIFDFAASAREALPEAFIEISTNGLVLTYEKYIKIIGLINKIYINDYRDDFKVSPHLMDIQKKIEFPPPPNSTAKLASTSATSTKS